MSRELAEVERDWRELTRERGDDEPYGNWVQARSRASRRLIRDIPDLIKIAQTNALLVVENARLMRQYSDQERFNIESRRSLCEQSDRYKAERDSLQQQLDAKETSGE